MPLAVCATPIGNLGDVTLRVLEELREADVVLCEDTRRTRILLERYGVAARLQSHHRHNEAARTKEVLGRLERGERIALVSDAGLPGVNDPGARLIAAAIAAGLPVTVLPVPRPWRPHWWRAGWWEIGTSSSGTSLGASASFARWRARSPDGRMPVVAFESPRRLAASLGVSGRGATGPPGRRVPGADEAVRGGRARDRGGACGPFTEPPKGEITLVLGAGSGASRQEADASGEAVAIAAVAELVAAGLARRQAVDVVARLTGAARNRLYRSSL